MNPSPTYAEARTGQLVQATVERPSSAGHYRRIVYRPRHVATAIEALFWFEGHQEPAAETRALEAFRVQARTETLTVWVREQ